MDVHYIEDCTKPSHSRREAVNYLVERRFILTIKTVPEMPTRIVVDVARPMPDSQPMRIARHPTTTNTTTSLGIPFGSAAWAMGEGRVIAKGNRQTKQTDSRLTQEAVSVRGAWRVGTGPVGKQVFLRRCCPRFSHQASTRIGARRYISHARPGNHPPQPTHANFQKKIVNASLTVDGCGARSHAQRVRMLCLKHRFTRQ